MSDIGIIIPGWLAVVLIAIEFWPVLFAVAVLLAIFALLVRGVARAVLILLVLVMLAPGAAALLFWQQRREDDAKLARYEESIHSTLAAPQTVDGFLLPAGTPVQWTDPTHQHLQEAWFDDPFPFAGLTLTSGLQREPDGWTVTLAHDGPVDGWPCKAEFVTLTPSLHLANCRLAAEKNWNGWQLPVDTLVEMNEQRGLLDLVVPSGVTLDVPQVGPVTPSGSFRVFSDAGSMYQMYFDEDKPLVVDGAQLWNTVTWLYSGTAHQPGAAVAVTGTLLNDVTRPEGTLNQGEQVRIDLATRRLARCDGDCGD